MSRTGRKSRNPQAAPVEVILTGAASFSTARKPEVVYRYGVPVPVEAEEAEWLLATGLFSQASEARAETAAVSKTVTEDDEEGEEE